MRVFAAWVMTMVIAIFLILAVFVTQKLHDSGIKAKNGCIRLEDNLAYDKPVYLNGEWEELKDGWEDNAAVDSGENPKVTFPIGSVIQAHEDTAYRIRFYLPEVKTSSLFLAIPTYTGSLDIYLNGVKQEPVKSDNLWISSGSLKMMVPLSAVDSDKEWQELVLSSDFSEKDVTLFQRPILIGTMQNLTTLTIFDSSAELFVLGILILVLVNGFVFMLFRPNHLIISLITVFDSTIMLRVFFSMNYSISLLKSVFPNIEITDSFCRSAELFFLMMGGIIGCILSGVLFDPQKKAPRWLINPTPYMYGIFALIFPMRMDLFEKFGSTLLIAVYVYTFIGVFCQFIICWKVTDKRGYYLFQFIKTFYIGVVVFWDISFWTKYKDFSVLLYLYAIFFIMHVVVRLYDNNQSYRDVEILNQSLEATVLERTKELSKANQILSELSIRDPLTNAFNRLYFERTIEKALEESNENGKNLHLCIFDLDFFKRVNDTYGHVAGDEMLKKVTEIVIGTVEEEVTFARIGGEEFVLLYEGKTDEEAAASVRAVHRAIEDNARDNPKCTTASFGVCSWKPGDTQKALMKNADAALYEAKNNGRNCVVLSEN